MSIPFHPELPEPQFSAPGSEMPTMPPQPFKLPSNPPGFAVLEIMGHRRRAGWVEEVTVFGEPMARVYIPSDGDPKTWRFEDYGGKAIFSTRWCDEATARYVAADIERYEPQPGPPQLSAFVATSTGDDDEPAAGDEPADDEELAF